MHRVSFLVVPEVDTEFSNKFFLFRFTHSLRSLRSTTFIFLSSYSSRSNISSLVILLQVTLLPTTTSTTITTIILLLLLLILLLLLLLLLQVPYFFIRHQS